MADPAARRAELEERLEALVLEARESGLALELALLLRSAALELESERGPDAQADGEPTKTRYGMVGDSMPMQKIYSLIERVAPSNVPVLVLGETGTGKELVARALHENSPRRAMPFLAENCAAVPANLLESELFGHKRGAFTGAIADRPGHFVAADGGTVFLDEIGDMPLEMQSKLLRVLQDGEVRPVGANKTQRVDVRVVAATNKDLVAMCRRGEFREDLYFRLNVITIQLPPLRERRGDVRKIATWLMHRIGTEMGRPGTIREEALAAMERWHWPGNVRELENEIRRALALSRGPIGLDDLSPALRAAV